MYSLADVYVTSSSTSPTRSAIGVLLIVLMFIFIIQTINSEINDMYKLTLKTFDSLVNVFKNNSVGKGCKRLKNVPPLVAMSVYLTSISDLLKSSACYPT